MPSFSRKCGRQASISLIQFYVVESFAAYIFHIQRCGCCFAAAAVALESMGDGGRGEMYVLLLLLLHVLQTRDQFDLVEFISIQMRIINWFLSKLTTAHGTRLLSLSLSVCAIRTVT